MDIATRWTEEYYHYNNNFEVNDDDKLKLLVSLFLADRDQTGDGSASKGRQIRYRNVLDYHKLYRSKQATPSQVMERLIQGATDDQTPSSLFLFYRRSHPKTSQRMRFAVETRKALIGLGWTALIKICHLY